MSLVVTGTGTEIGKTITCAVLLTRYSGHRSPAYWKPIATGSAEGRDTHVIRELCGDSVEVLEEMMRLAQRAESALRKLYKPDGLNLGMNIGKAAGAGIGGHIHLHVLPRWIADSNFVTVVGETRVLPEELPETWRRLHAEFHPPSS